MRNVFISGLLALFLILIVPAVSAEIMLSQPKSVYSLGDELSISATVKPDQNAEGFLKMALSCPDGDKEFYLSPLTMTLGQEKKIDSSISLTQSFLGNLLGVCYIIVDYGNELEKSQAFTISNKINVMLSIEKASYNAGENFIFSGNAVKMNNEKVDGFVDLSIEGTEFKITKTVSQGIFRANFTIPENMKSGSYSLTAKVYSKDSQGNLANQGENSVFIRINQVPTKLEIVMDKQDYNPGDNIVFKVFLYDQANDPVIGDVALTIKKPDDSIFLKKLLKTNEDFELEIPNNMTPGYWKAEASYNELLGKRLFQIQEYEKAEFKILNDTLIVTNMGNVPYKKIIEISIGGESELVKFDSNPLPIGGSKRYRLVAPVGNYNIKISDGSMTLEQASLSLTGNAINVEELGNKAKLISRYPLVWIFLIIIFGLFAVMMVERVRKGTFMGYEAKTSLDEKLGRDVERISKTDISNLELKKDITQAEHSLVLNGIKQEAAITTLRIKNIRSLSKESREKIERAIEESKTFKAAAYRNGDDIMFILTPTLTKSFRNIINASKLANSIANVLDEHNRKFSDKIQFGIGVNKGEIIVKIENGKLKFTAIGNVLANSKKIADNARNEILLSREAHNEAGSEVKNERIGEFYKVHGFSQREENRKFIEDFQKRL